MHKIVFGFLLLLITFGLNAQSEEDSAYYEDYTKDTNSVFHFGFIMGGSAHGLLYSDDNDLAKTDTFNILNSKVQFGLSIGIIIEKDFSEKLWLRSGVHINLSKLNLDYMYRNEHINYTFNYSSLEFPIWLQYSFKNKRRGLSWGGGFTSSVDITRKSDKKVRDISFNSFDLLVGTGPSWRWMLPSGSYLNTSLVLNIGVLNFIDESSEKVINQYIVSTHRWQLQLFISLN